MIPRSKLPQIDHEGVAERLECLRLALELDKGAFAQSFGLDPSSYSKVIAGAKPLKTDHAYTIAERWGVSMDFLYRGDLSRIPEHLRRTIITSLSKR